MIEETFTALQERIAAALSLAEEFGQVDGDHHKAWVIDRMVHALLGSDEDYETWVDAYCYGEEDGFMLYSWDTGVAP